MRDNKGNALFLILIAVALFAALSYAVTQSGRGGGSIDREQALIISSQYIEYMGSIRSAISRMKIINACSDDEISFDTDVYEDGGDNLMLPVPTNPNTRPDFSCNVFHSNGGQVTPVIMLQGAVNNSGGAKPGHAWFPTYDVTNIGTSAIDILMVFHHIEDSVCEAYNEQNNSGFTNAVQHNWIGGNFSGTYSSGAIAGFPVGIDAWCYNSNSGNPLDNHLIMVIYER
jgi:hypothetical protein